MAANSNTHSLEAVLDLHRPDIMNERVNPSLMRAIHAHQGGRLAEAEAGYRRILRKRPRDADALNFLGMLYVQKGDAEQGTQLLRRSVESLPSNPHAWLNLGNAHAVRGDWSSAREAFDKAVGLAPTMPEAWFNLGVCLRGLKQRDAALECFGKAVEHGPGYGAAYEAMGSLLYRAGRDAEAAEAYRRWLQCEPDNPVARHMLAATSGENVPLRADDAYLADVFDKFASTFDENLHALGYRAPQLLAAALTERLAPRGGAVERRDILDAGCGTGLCAPLLRPLASRLTGVDISAGMTEKARERGGYDELVVEELTAFMRARPAAFDIVISADTLVYFGSLREPLEAARTCLRDGGLLAFTLEQLDSPEPYQIRPHGRYGHSEAYVQASLAEAGFARTTLEKVVLRRERGEDVAGHLVVAA